MSTPELWEDGLRVVPTLVLNEGSRGGSTEDYRSRVPADTPVDHVCTVNHTSDVEPLWTEGTTTGKVGRNPHPGTRVERRRTGHSDKTQVTKTVTPPEWDDQSQGSRTVCRTRIVCPG